MFLNYQLLRIKIEELFIIVFFVMIFSFQFHALWLLYDILAIFSIFYFIKTTNKALFSNILFSLCYFFILLIVSGSYSISFLSIWDNIKHVFVLFVLFSILNKHMEYRSLKFVERIGKVLFYTFIIEVIMVFYQYFSGYHFDDISGTFGYGASHAIGYFSLLFISYLLYIKQKNSLGFFLIILTSLVINYMSENMGFYILLFVLFMFKNIKQFSVFLMITIIVIFFSSSVGIDFVFSMVSRYIAFFNMEDVSNLEKIASSRGPLMAYAWFLGGFFGAGPGSFSSVYGMVGWKVDTLLNSQINISSATNLLSEYGLIGMLLWILLYLKFLFNFASDYKTKIFMTSFFILVFFYNRLLMDERIIYMVVLLISFVNISTKIRIKSS